MLSGSQILAEEVRVFRFDRPRAPLESLINCLMWGTLSALTSRDAEAPIVRL